jgi:hypothetical protein
VPPQCPYYLKGGERGGERGRRRRGEGRRRGG